MRRILTFSASLVLCAPLLAADEPHPLSSIPLREIGPALTSGRVSDFAQHPQRPEVRYVGFASGGIFKTENDGTTWTPVFDGEGAYAIGVVTLDPNRPQTVWVGTGENNSQRSVGYGDGVYRSLDGGASWQNMGLKNSGHIGKIAVHPDDGNVVYVAALGPLWSDGGDRGLYRSNDGGASWDRLLNIDTHTGVNEFVLQPGDPDVIVASSYQRRRHVWTLINGGPGSGIHKSTDGGRSWRRITSGLPKGDMGRIGLASAPTRPEVIYAIIEADEKERGVYRSTDFGESWEKRSDHMTSSGQYYNELYVDPHDPDRVYAVDTFTHRSDDGGRTWQRLSITNRHVDDHAMWFDPERPGHWRIGGDGGEYETWDDGETWRHTRNLPAAQFYRATPDNDTPFYNVCAGTQDNHTLCGPSRTTYTDGITNGDWWIAQNGDGFKPQFDPDNPDIVYAQYQHGGLVRMDRVTGERLAITPIPPAGENDYKWNWNSPLIVSPHDPARLYYASERVFRSDDRGDNWRPVSPDLSRQLDRNTLPVMGRVWSVDAIAKNASTSMYGSIIALDESPLVEGLLYVGTDDGLVRVSGDGGENWSRVQSFPGVPDRALVEDIVASRHDANTAYAVIDNHKQGDYAPHVLKTNNRGQSWVRISANLPEWGSAHTLAEDHVDPDLLFVGTEYGVFFSQDRGGSWHELTALPTIAVRDLEIQRRENDLVIGTFGRGIWLLDDYAPLRTPVAKLKESPTLFAVRDAWLFLPDARRGWGGRGDYGQARYAADNPPHGALIGYHLPEAIQSLREERRAQEKKRAKDGGDNPYPAWERLREEDREEAPALTVEIRDAGGAVVRRLDAPTEAGFHRVAWDLRFPAPDPVNLQPDPNRSPWLPPPQGPLATPGTYSASLTVRERGESRSLAGPVEFTVKPLTTGGLVAADPADVLAFQQRTAALYRAVTGAGQVLTEMNDRVAHLRRAVRETPAATPAQAATLDALTTRLQDLDVALNGDSTLSSRAEPVPLSISGRVSGLVYGHWSSRAAVPPAYRESYTVADQQFTAALAELRAIESALVALEAELDALGAPWTPGRIPAWPAADGS